MHELIGFQKKRKNFTFVVTSFLILISVLVSPAVASVNNWDFSPKEPLPGDIIQLKGNAAPGDKVDIFVNFEKTVPVSEGKFEYILEDVKIPGGLNNFFKVDATGAKNLNVRAKMVIWITKSSEASGDVVTVSQSSVPEGTYRIKIDGDAKEGVSNVYLKITAFQGIEADSEGNFEYAYNTKSVPSGDFQIKVGDTSKTVTILSEENSNTSPDLSPKKPSESKLPESASIDSNTSLPTENKSLPKTADLNNTQVQNITSDSSDSNKNLSANNTQKNLSGNPAEKSESSGFILDKLYLLAGIGVGALILIIYSFMRRK